MSSGAWRAVRAAGVGLLLLASGAAAEEVHEADGASREAPASDLEVAAPEADLLARANLARSARAMPPLALDPSLSRIARAHARELARLGAATHLSPESGMVLGERLAVTFAGYEGAAENVASGPDVETVHRGLMASAGHRANLLDPTFDAVGIGIAWRSQRFLYAVQDFLRGGRLRDPAEPAFYFERPPGPLHHAPERPLIVISQPRFTFREAVGEAVGAGETEAAIVRLRTVVAAAPRAFEPRFNLAQLLATHGRPDEAIVLLTALQRERPGDAEVLGSLGVAHLKAGLPWRAAATLARAIQLAPADLVLRQWLGNAYFATRAYGKAAEQYRRILADSPAHVDVRFSLGLTLEQLGDAEGARACYRRVLAEQREHEAARQRLEALAAAAR